MDEYTIENGHHIDTSALQVGQVPIEEYKIAHAAMSYVCHDVIVKIDDTYLLVERDAVPAKGILWPLGGRLMRGVSVEDSIKDRVLKEAGIQITNLQFLGVARTLFETDPLGHGKGTDTVNLMYMAQGDGEVQLDHLHKSPTLFTKEQYQSELRDTLHPYVVGLLDRAIEL